MRNRLRFIRRNLWLLLIAACALHSSSSVSVAQNSALAAPPANASRYRIAGTVVSAVNGNALPRARVVLSNPKNLQDARATTASEDGHFAFENIAAGKYVLGAAKNGYIGQSYNQHEEFSTAIVTGADVDTENLIFRLVPAAVLSVKVTDESGEPVQGATVTLYRETHGTGERQVSAVNTRATDDLGICEFTRLIAGTYFVSVMATPWYAIHPMISGPSGEETVAADLRIFDVAYPLTFYGDSTDPDSASPMLIHNGEHAQAEIHLGPVAALHLLFHTRENGFAIPSFQKLVFDHAQFQQNISPQQISPGLFEISGVAPGKYRVTLPGVAPAEADVTTNGQDLSDVNGEPVSSVTATVRVLGGGKLPEMLTIKSQNSDQYNPQPVNDKGEVSFTGVNPGAYQILAGDRTRRYAVVSVSSAGVETPGYTVNVPPGASMKLSIALTEGSANVEGFAKKGGKGFAGAMIVLVPKDPQTNRELFRRDQSDLDGSFLLQGVPSGSYTVVAIEDGWSLDWAVPEVIEKYAQHGEPVMVGGNAGAAAVKLPGAVEVQPQ